MTDQEQTIITTTKSRNNSLVIAVIVMIVIVGWVASGVLVGEVKPPQHDYMTLNTDMQKVRIMESRAQGRVRMIALNGVTEANRRIDIKAEVLGTITEILANEGNIVEAGQALFTIELRDRKARLIQAQAQLISREIDYNASKKLSLSGFQSETRLAESLQELENARALLIQADIALENTHITAPFAGILNFINTEVGSLVGPGIATGKGSLNEGNSIAVLVDTNPLIVSGNVSERNIFEVKIGAPCLIELITGQTLHGTLHYISKIADSATRTFRIEITVDNQDYTIPSGVTAHINIPLGHQLAHHVSSAHLALNKDGDLGIKIFKIAKQQTATNGIEGEVEFHPVNIYDYDTTGAWVSNLPKKVNIITLGQAFVKDGEKAIGMLESLD